jgi:GntR family transcriptional regulator / MocR family aminotransferase
MTQRFTPVSLSSVALDPASPVPLYRQLYTSLRDAILTQRMPGGGRLPSTRVLASALGVSRNTVLNAVEQLVAEGYLEGRHGAGTFVAPILPDLPMPTSSEPLNGAAPTRPTRHLSGWMEMISARVRKIEEPIEDFLRPRPFTLSAIARDDFPTHIWSKLLYRQWTRGGDRLRRPPLTGGYEPLRAAIAAHLAESRGVRCTPEQVLIVSGCEQAVELTARVLLNPGDTAWMEDPGYGGARRGIQSIGATAVPVPLDREGLIVSVGAERYPDARLAFVSPSCQFPLGETLSLSRRLALLAWANRKDAWIIEDDYDSEYRFYGRPLASLQSLDEGGRVIYVGTFEWIMFTSLRLGYIVAPPDLVDAFHAACAYTDVMLPVLEQAALADFIMEGHFERRVRRLRALYAERQEALLDAAKPLAGLLEVRRRGAGGHALGWLPPGVDDRMVAARVDEAGIAVYPLSAFAMEPLYRGGLLMGYYSIDAPEIRDGMQRLGAVLEAAIRVAPQPITQLPSAMTAGKD